MEASRREKHYGVQREIARDDLQGEAGHFSNSPAMRRNSSRASVAL